MVNFRNSHQNNKYLGKYFIALSLTSKKTTLMTQPLICHFLIGLPASGKSTFARKLREIIPDAVIVSTDTIRHQLYQDESIQGDWENEVEPEVLNQIEEAISDNKPVIYDATNARRDWRMGISIEIKEKLRKIDTSQVYWIAWYLQTPVDMCQKWNKKRERKIPNEIIERYEESLYQFPPHKAEGFIQIYNVLIKEELRYEVKIDKKTLNIEQAITTKRDIINTENRKKKYTWHQYSRLLDFERLMHLLSTIIRYPGIGNLSHNEPEILIKVLNTEKLPKFNNSIEEIFAVLKKEYAPLYADKKTIKRDLNWLEKNGLIGNIDVNAKVSVNTLEDSEITQEYELFSHRYSDLETFTRLIKIIRLITYYPFLRIDGKTAIKKIISGNEFDKVRCTAIVEELIDRNIVFIDKDNMQERKTIENNVREDIRQLSPYRIIHDPFKTRPYTKNFSKYFAMNKGYFIGTGIFSQDELNELFNLLRAQSEEKYFNDPLAQNTYQIFKERMKNSKLWQEATPYPVKVIGSKSAVDFNQGVNHSRFEAFDKAIRNSELIELEFLRQPWETTENLQYLRVYPLQIVFHLFAWYLGYEVEEEGEKQGLLYFERIDRLRVNNILGSRSEERQVEALDKLNKLYQASAGIYLGNNVSEQEKYLNRNTRKEVEETLKIFAKKHSFNFLSETTERFSNNQMKMSLPEWLEGKPYNKKIYSLSIQQDRKHYNYQIQITLPKWSIDDIYLIKWLVPWGNKVKVTQPERLVQKIKERGDGIQQTYGKTD